MSKTETPIQHQGERGAGFVNAVLDAHPAHIAIVDHGGQIVTVNQSWLRFAEANDGIDSASLLPGGNYLAVCDAAVGDCAAEAPEIAEALRSILAGEQHEYEREYACHSPNELRWFTISIRGFEYEGAHHAVVSHVDCTDDHLDRDHFKKLSLVARATSNAVIITDASERIEWVNEGFTRITGYEAVDVLGKRPADVLQGPATSIDAKRAIKQAIDRGEPIKTEILNYTKGGAPYWLEMDVQPIRDESGQITNFIAIQSDISERVEADKKLRAAQAEAETAAKTKSEFLANMSHELRTPLTAILGFTDILAESAANNDEIEILSTICRNGRHLLELINQILDLSKLESGAFVIESVPTNPRQIVRDIVETLRMPAESKNVGVSAHCDDAIPERIVSDPLRLKQIVMNLVGNAIKFTECGEVCVEATVVDDELHINVIDTGIGMDRDAAVNMFKPFSQADASVTRRFGGTGLGLSISQKLAEQMGGELSLVSSELGKGTHLRVKLPCISVNDDEAVVHQRDRKCSKTSDRFESTFDMPLKGMQILLVEDGPDNRRLVSHILSKRGADVHTAVNGLECLNKIYPTGDVGLTPHLILMDMQMPVLDGYQATRDLRNKGCTIPIVALTAHARSGDRNKCLQAGCDEFETKPINRDRLIECIVNLVRRVPTSVS